MPLNPPRTLQTLLTGDNAASRAFQNVKTAVDPLLSFVNSTFQVANDGSLSFVRKIKTFAADAIVANSSFVANGPATLNRDLVVNGTTRANGDFYAAKRVVAVASGFKAYVPLGFYYNASYTVATGYVQATQYTQATSGATYLMPNYVQMPFAGSVVGITALYYGQAATVTYNVQIRGITTQPTYTATAPGQPYASSIAYARGVYNFSVGQNLQPFISFNSAGNQLLYIGAIVEWDT